MNKKVKLGEIVKIAGRVGWKGYTVEDLRDEGPWVIGANDITIDNRLELTKAKHISREKYEESPEIKIELNDILIVKVGSTIGKVAIVNKDIGEACINPNSVILKNCKINPSYLYYYLISSAGQSFLRNNSSASAQSALNQLTLKEMLIDIVEEKQQENISSILNNLNSKIELNKRINAELEAMAKTLYDYWFVQFDFTDKNGKPYKTSGGKMGWNEELRREIPQGWEVKELQEIAKCLMGQSPKGESYNQDGIGTPLLNGPADYENGALKGRTYTTEPTRLCQKDDLVLCIRATIGNLVYSEQEFCLGRGVAAVRANDKRLSELIYFLLIQEIERFKVQATGSIIVGITKDDLIESKCLVPKDELINSFHNLIQPQFDKIRINIKENQKLTELRDWLLPMLMNGQVKVN